MAGAKHGRRPRGWTATTLTLAMVTAVGGLLLGIGAARLAQGGTTEAAKPGAHVLNAAPSAMPDATASASAPRITPSPIAPGADRVPPGGLDLSSYSIDSPDSPWVVVNKQRPLDPVDFAPDDVASVPGVRVLDGGGLRQEAADALAAMHTAADQAGVAFKVSSAYRDYARQGEIYAEYVAESGTADADMFSARQGHSEHQTGWSADLFDTEACRLKECFGTSESGRWVAKHASEYGFILRYPEGTAEVTGYQYEPWHVRYIGVELATQMREQHVDTLEEFFGLPPAPDYAE